MILFFRCKETEKIFNRIPSRKFCNIQQIAYRKLVMLDSAINLNDLRTLPGTRLEVLIGDRKGQYSIRINNQWRICFVWKDGNAYQVEIVDYH